MVGYLRFFLAVLVVLSHLQIQTFGYNPGVIAVVVFYMLAGWVLSRLWHDILPPGPGKIAHLFLDRVLRIYPLYIAVLLITVFFLLVTGYGNAQYSLTKLFENITIIPLNYFMWADCAILRDPQWCLIPPAWSLGAELQAYLLLTVLFLFKQWKFCVFSVSLLVYVLADFGVLQSEYFGYRLIPGVLFIFLLGHFLQRLHAGRGAKEQRLVIVAVWLFSLSFLLYRGLVHPQYRPFVVETAVGITVGIPLIAGCHAMRLKLPGNRLFGALSYGLFLFHFLVIWALDYWGLTPQPDENFFILYAIMVVFISSLLAWCGTGFLEAPIHQWRISKICTGKSR